MEINEWKELKLLPHEILAFEKILKEKLGKENIKIEGSKKKTLKYKVEDNEI